MRRLRQLRHSLALPAGIAAGFFLTTWGTLHAAALLPNLFLGGVTDGATVSGVVSLTARADAAGLAALQFQVSGANLGAEITAGACSMSWDTRGLPNGSRTVSAIGRDSLGNPVYAAPVVVNVQNVDATSPAVSVAAPAAGANVSGTVTVTAAASDNVGIAGVWFTLDGATLGAESTSSPYQTAWTTTSTPNGSHVLRAFARDTAGNTAGSATVTVSVNNAVTDTTAPAVALASPSNGATVSGTIAVTASASDNVGVSGVQFKLDGANLSTEDSTSPYTINWSTSGVANGTHTLTAVARDAAGNRTTSAPISVTVNNVVADKTAPSVNLTSPTSGATISSTTTLSASASDNVAVVGVQFTLDNVNIGPEASGAPWSISWSPAGVSNGSHSLRAVARDAAGNRRTSTARTITVRTSTADTSSPSVAISAPAANSTVAGTVTVTASASDNVGVAGVQFTLDGANLGAEDTTAPFATTWTTTSASSGTHTLRAVARDAAGNRTTSATISVTVNNTVQDRTAPTVRLTSPAAGATLSSVVMISASASDDVRVAGVQFFVDGIAYGAEVLATPYQTAWSTAALPNGTYTLTATARDTAGNRATSTGVKVSVANKSLIAAATPGDFDGDGKPDLLWQSKTGGLYLWLMNGHALSDSMALNPGSVDPNWQVASIDDFDGDGRNDILWQHAVTGQGYAWLMNGATLRAGLDLGTTTSRAETTGDFNGDGKADIVVRDPNTGELSIGFMNGTEPISGTPTPIRRMGLEWAVAGTGDIDRDGTPDILCQNVYDGSLQVLYMNGAVVREVGRLTPGAVAPTWRLKAIADFNDDGHVDLVWQSTTGLLYIWYMNRDTMISGAYLGPGQTNVMWQIVGGR